MVYSAGSAAFAAAFEVAPIALTGGIASELPGGVMSVFSLLESLGLGDVSDALLSNVSGNFMPVSGSTLVENQYGTYPHANMSVAVNARIVQPLSVSMSMWIPATADLPALVRTSVLSALQGSLEQHCNSGGFFSVATPAKFYNNVLLLKLHDVSGGESHQTQYQYQWDFFKPLITQDDAAGAQNAQMSLLSSGAATDGATSGLGPSVGQPTTAATGAVAPSAAAAQGTLATGSGGGLSPSPLLT